MPEGFDAPQAKSPHDSALGDLVVQSSRKHSLWAETLVPHRLHAEDADPSSELLQSW